MRLRNTFILITIAAALAGYFLLVERPRHRRSQERAKAEADLAAFSLNDAAVVNIARPDVTLNFVREGGDWHMTDPLPDRAESAAVMRLLGALSDGQIARDLGQQPDPTPFGLLEPAASITVVTASGDTVVAVDVGGLTVDKYHAYARLRDAEPHAGVLLIPTGVRRYALAKPSSFRNKRVVDFDLASVERFTISRPDGATTWVRTEERGWTTDVEGKTIRGDKGTVEQILRRLRGLRVAEFVPEAELPAVAPFDSPPRSVVVSLAGGGEQSVSVGRVLESRVYADSRLAPDDPGRVVLTDTTVLDIFDQTVFDLRDRHMLRFDRRRLGKLVLESADITVTLVRPADEWSLPNPKMGAIDQKKVGRAFTALSELEYDRVIDEDPADAASFGLSNPDLRLTMFDEGGAQIDQLVCKRGDGASDIIVAASGYSGVIARLRKGDLDAVVSRFENLRQP